MELHKLQVRQYCSRLVRDRHAVARGHFRIRRLTVNLTYAAGRQQHRSSVQLVL